MKLRPLSQFKRMLPILIICFIIGFSAIVLGIVNYKNNLLSAQTNQANEAGAYINNIAETIAGESDAQHLLAILNALETDNHIYHDAVESCYIYDKKSNTLLSCDSAADTDSILAVMADQKFDENVAGGFHYIPITFNENQNLTLIFVCSTAEISKIINGLLPYILAVFLISFLILAAVLVLAGCLMNIEKHFKNLTCVLVFLWIFAMSCGLALFSGAYLYIQYQEDRAAISSDIAEDIHKLNAMNDTNLAAYTAHISVLTGDKFEQARQQAGGNDRLAVIYLNMSLYDHYSNYFSSVETKANIMDESVAIEDRLVFNLNENYTLNCGINYFLQILMLSSCAIVLILDIYHYEGEKIKARLAGSKNNPGDRNPRTSESDAVQTCEASLPTEKSPSRRRKRRLRILVRLSRFLKRYDESYGNRLKLVFTFYRIAEALVTTVFVILLRRFILQDYPAYGSTIIAIVIFSSGLIDFAADYLYNRIFLRVMNSFRFMRISLVLILGGIALCYVTEAAWLYVFGYVLINFGMGLIYNTIDFHIQEVPKSSIKHVIEFVKMGGRAGHLIGLVLAAVISTLINDTGILLIAGIIVIIALVLTLGFSAADVEHHVPQKISYFKILKSPNMLIYGLLIIMPAAFANYFMSYKVPLDIEAFGLTVSMYAFLEYLRELVILYCKYNRKTQAPFKKIDPAPRAVLLNSMAAGVILLYCCFNRYYTMIVAVIVLAVIRSNFGRSLHSKILELDLDDLTDSSRLNVLNREGKSLGKSIASVLTENVGFISLPIIMLIGSAGFFMKNKLKKSHSPSTVDPVHQSHKKP